METCREVESDSKQGIIQGTCPAVTGVDDEDVEDS